MMDIDAMTLLQAMVAMQGAMTMMFLTHMYKSAQFRGAVGAQIAAHSDRLDCVEASVGKAREDVTDIKVSVAAAAAASGQYASHR